MGTRHGEKGAADCQHLSLQANFDEPKSLIIACQTVPLAIMSANYWTSTQRKYWTFTPEKLAEKRRELEKAYPKIYEQYPYPDRRHLLIFVRDRLLQLAKRLPFRQQCVATSLVYLQRYFLFYPVQNLNLYLILATSFYLSSKTEESPHHIRLVAAEARQSWPEFVPGDVSRLGEMEFCLISEMKSQLIVWHPYRSLIALKENQDLKLTNDELGLAWSIINDSFMTDLPLTCPPHLTAVIAMFLAVIFLPSAKASGALRPLTHDTVANPESGPFSSFGGSRPAMSGPFNNLLTSLHMSNQQNGSQSGANQSNPNMMGQTQSRFSHQHSLSQSSTQSQPQNTAPGSYASTAGSSEREKTVQAIKDSERMQALMKFLVESDLDITRMIEGTQEMISLYDCWEQYNEKAVKDVVGRCLKARGLDS